MTMFLLLEKLFHVGKTVVNAAGKSFLVQTIRDTIKQKEAI